MSQVGRSLLFYSAWPLDYHNIEAERKAVRLAQEGYDVVYVAGVGTRNPRLSRLPKLADRVRRKLVGGGADAPVAVPGLRTAALAVVPPRQLARLRGVNERWLERQMRRAIGDWGRAVAWVRWPTQELVTALTRLRPALVVYESVDANHLSPGIEGRWRPIFEDAERALVALADVVVVPGEVLAERYRPWGTPVQILPHGVELGTWRQDRGAQRPPRPGAAGAREAPTLGFVGSLDYRLEVPTIRAVAEARPDWAIRLIGPLQEGFDPRGLSGLGNVSIEPPVAPAEVPVLNSAFDVGLLAYFDHPHYFHGIPMKALELLAAGTPVVGRWSPALGDLGHLVRFAATPAEYVRQVEAALAEDSPALARARRTEAEGRSWDRSLTAMCRLLDDELRDTT